METVDDLPGLRRVKRWVVIRAQKRRLSQLPEDRGLMSLSEVVQELVDSGVQPDSGASDLARLSDVPERGIGRRAGVADF